MSERTGWVEKRRHERVVTKVKVNYRVIGSKEAKETLAQDSYRGTTADKLPGLSQVSPLYEAVTNDISVGGLSIVGDQPLAKGSVVEVDLTLPGYKTSLKFLAEVVRAEEGEQKGDALRSGVKTLAINREDVMRMEQYLIEEMKKKK